MLHWLYHLHNGWSDDWGVVIAGTSEAAAAQLVTHFTSGGAYTEAWVIDHLDIEAVTPDTNGVIEVHSETQPD